MMKRTLVALATLGLVASSSALASDDNGQLGDSGFWYNWDAQARLKVTNVDPDGDSAETDASTSDSTLEAQFGYGKWIQINTELDLSKNFDGDAEDLDTNDLFRQLNVSFGFDLAGQPIAIVVGEQPIRQGLEARFLESYDSSAINSLTRLYDRMAVAIKIPMEILEGAELSVTGYHAEENDLGDIDTDIDSVAAQLLVHISKQVRVIAGYDNRDGSDLGVADSQQANFGLVANLFDNKVEAYAQVMWLDDVARFVEADWAAVVGGEVDLGKLTEKGYLKNVKVGAELGRIDGSLTRWAFQVSRNMTDIGLNGIIALGVSNDNFSGDTGTDNLAVDVTYTHQFGNNTPDAERVKHTHRASYKSFEAQKAALKAQQGNYGSKMTRVKRDASIEIHQ